MATNFLLALSSKAEVLATEKILKKQTGKAKMTLSFDQANGA